ncbi:tRNA pseudouridine(38-40) synthase TruA [Synechococcus sp. PCC 7336]|uniref:tRNA pseudouridine(38-40) synthase TruA n=1 Tax=Synechococcus sp. PCC 7336 TaxID=195250 RepID=UPI00035E624A|nr:tRNA pseudouridine(38-40) synthase TruA [Synechococcus sp. PCC 7336]
MPSTTAINRRIALKLQYLGTSFFGWQRQTKHRSVQGVLEKTLSRLIDRPTDLSGAGRTDTGVHASAQVAHFDTPSAIPIDRWGFALNNALPRDVSVQAVAEVATDWHSRFSAVWRSYRYAIWNAALPNVFWQMFSWHYRRPLDEQQMDRALQTLLGENDLEIFRLSGSKRTHSRVQVLAVQCWRSGPLVWIDVKASGFLYRMMRLLVGALVCVGLGEIAPRQFEQMWRDRKRSPIRYSAPARGLCLTGVGYPSDPFLASQPLDVASVATFPFAVRPDRFAAESPVEQCFSPALP